MRGKPDVRPLQELADACVLVVDDMNVNIHVFKQALEAAGCGKVVTETDPWKVVDVVAEANPNVIFLDIDMPELDGFGVLQLLQKEAGLNAPIPVIAMNPGLDAETRQRALDAGIFDFVPAPYAPEDVVLRARNALRFAAVEAQLSAGYKDLEAIVRSRTEELDTAYMEILDRLALAAEYRDDDTGDHTRRVGDLSAKIAATHGVSPGVCEMIRRAAPLHDVGKIGIPDAVLLKPTALDETETAIMQAHTTIGARIVTGNHPVLWLAGEICVTHHERWDGTGYPRRLLADDIPLPGRIVSVADVFDTLTHDRAYREAWPRHRAISEILDQSGKAFDPRVVDAFLKVSQEEQGPAQATRAR